MHYRTRYRMALLAAAAAAVAGALGGCSGDGDGAATPKGTVLMPGRPGEPNKTAVAGPSSPAPPTAAEFRFIEMMIPHHQQAVEMASLAPGQASDPQVKAMAERIDATQNVEIAAMQNWLRQHGRGTSQGQGGHTGHGAHGGASPSASAHANMPGMATPQQMEQLRKARGKHFDRLFLNLMINHHQGALTMVKDVLDKGTDVTAQQIARDVQSTQQAEINRMRALLDG
ncbi:lipoprotein [Actinomadura sp. NBRC 104425]|uniref:DUF305 domain-containing protein n=1 Tax=Actinomadura sp. NBRC 104425 TaxID=3032204 RepID=UPI0024A5AAFA|nr:DUF305 domain-containing protein [Actinomadura sp. NBRC 104425]GLZ11007.1 lipoprotein [Actinomadura sp. NBRC 104425]